jgi:His/Glu/Gln/Arg/opine family amino acid ABC transporter permease subunit
MSDVVTLPDLETAPEPPPKGPVLWLRHNLFSTPASGFLSIVAIAVSVLAYKGLLAFVLDPGRRWDAVTFNMKLLMVFAYPADELWRIWLTVGIVVVLLAASFAAWKIGGMAEPRAVGKTLMGVGAVFVLGAMIAPLSRNPQIAWLALGAVMMLAGYALRVWIGEKSKEAIVPIMGVIGVLIVIGLALIWTLDLPVPAKLDDGRIITDRVEAGTIQGSQITVFRPIAESTTLPWTIIAGLGAVTYLLFGFVSSRNGSGGLKKILMILWALSFPLLVLVLIRDPVWDWGAGLRIYLPALLIFGTFGTAVLWFVARPGSGEAARVIGGLLLVAAFITFLFPMPFIFRLLMLAVALFGLAGPTFGGEGVKGLVYGWLIMASTIAFFTFTISTVSGIKVPTSFMLGGLGLTIILSFSALVLSFPFGIILALGRTSTMPIFRLLSTAYIELIRGVPLITWLLIAFLMLPVALPEGIEVGGVVRAIAAMAFFNAAYLAENVRGGLQSIPVGQKEASKALGLTTLQETIFITLPQALRAVLPALVGQVIALFKDTSLVTIVGLFDFLHIARQVIPSQSTPFSFLGSIKETLLFAALVYWLFTFTFSRISLRLEKKLGVGER